MNFLKTSFNKVVFWTKKHLPDIMMVAGVTGVCTGTGLAVKKSLDRKKIDPIINDSKKEIAHAKRFQDKKDVTKAYAKATFNIAKYYALPAGLFVGGMSSIIYSHAELNARNAALSATITTYAAMFKEYRENTIKKYGKQVDEELRHGIKIVDDKKDPKKAKIVKDKSKVNQYSDYAKFFDETNPNFTKNPEYNMLFLKRAEAYCNDKLQCQGYLFLNDVYKELGIPATKAGQIVGWRYFKDGKNDNGDNYVSFGLFDITSASARHFVNGYENVILLDFNVDGNILDDMK